MPDNQWEYAMLFGALQRPPVKPGEIVRRALAEHMKQNPVPKGLRQK